MAAEEVPSARRPTGKIAGLLRCFSLLSSLFYLGATISGIGSWDFLRIVGELAADLHEHGKVGCFRPYCHRLPRNAEKLIGDKAYDSDGFNAELPQKQNIELVAPHRRSRKKPKTRNGRTLRRHKYCRKAVRLSAWLGTSGGRSSGMSTFF